MARKKQCKGFTLIELLVVILIIGILAAIALPQYELAVERSRIAEAAIILRAISSAQERFYMLNDRYANAYEMAELDIEIPGKIAADSGVFQDRIETSFFVYSPDGDNNGSVSNPLPEGFKAYAQRKPIGSSFTIALTKSNKLRCINRYSTIKPVQSKLCDKINAQGYL